MVHSNVYAMLLVARVPCFICLILYAILLSMGQVQANCGTNVKNDYVCERGAVSLTNLLPYLVNPSGQPSQGSGVFAPRTMNLQTGLDYHPCLKNLETVSAVAGDELACQLAHRMQHGVLAFQYAPDSDTAPVEPPLQASDNLARKYNPPPLSNPQIYTVSGNGLQKVNLPPGQDAVVTCNGGTINGWLAVSGGRNVVVRDCNINMDCGPPDQKPSWDKDSALHLGSFTGTFVSFENLDIDSADCIADAVVVNKKTANGAKYDVYFYNSRILAGNGVREGLHADVFQDQNTLADLHKNIYVENIEAGSWYSGFTSYYADNAYISNVSLVNNSKLGKTCVPKVAADSGAKSICDPNKGLAPTIEALNVFCERNAFLYGYIDINNGNDRSKIKGDCVTHDPNPRSFVGAKKKP